MPVEIRSVTPDDWERIREIRIRMIEDTPIAYVETAEAARAHGEGEWRSRGERGIAPHSLSIAAVDESGAWVGAMGGFVDAAHGPLLVGVFVAPEVRGRAHGVADALLDRVEEWARGEGDTLTLAVHEDNARARAFYERRGFVATGETEEYPLPPHGTEVFMRKAL
ncbi:GNAT family N-acetyltransferase [Microbacterium indicum]|uniref:GNAT family N-acetyltransferase n=1 Tax=Microbacterium indicum TaxID=358100 RepID=UPI000412E21B|nr:GNAT family N-acetyltransferase [Microbacterium indicum]